MEMENKLPNNWVETLLSDAVFFQEGPGLRTLQMGTNGMPFLNIRTFNDDETLDKSKCKFVKLEEFKNKYEHFLLNEGDIVVSSSGTLGKAIVIRKEDLPVMLNTSVIRFRALSEELMTQKFLKYFLKTDYFYKQIQAQKTGMAIDNFGPSHLLQMQIVIPPLAEQHRIVAKLDAIMQKLERNRQRLDKIPKLLKRFRQSVLAAAVSGKLTEEWREKNNFENLFEISEQFSINDTYREQNELPKNWKWVALGNYVKCNRGRFSIRPRNDPRYFGGSIPFIQIGDLPREGGFVNTHTQTLNELGLKVSKMFPKNTLAIAIVGATIANTGILAYDMCFTDSMVGMNKGDLDLNLFIDYYLRIEKENFRQLSYAGGGQPNIKLELLNAYPFPLPPKEEQIEIVRRIEQLFAFADKIEARYTKAKTMLDKLPQSILAKAFRGELVAQDPNDESASVLLERIKVEKEKLAAEKKVKKSKEYSIEEKPVKIAAEKGVKYKKGKK